MAGRQADRRQAQQIGDAGIAQGQQVFGGKEVRLGQQAVNDLLPGERLAVEVFGQALDVNASGVSGDRADTGR